MRLDLHIPPDVFTAILQEANTRETTQAAIIREKLAKAYGLAANLPERRRPIQPRKKITWGPQK